MKTFIFTFLLIASSIFLGALLLYVSLWFAWGKLIDFSTGTYLSVLTAIVFYILGLYYLIKKESVKKVILSNVVIFLFLSPIIYIYFIKDNSKLYSYDDFPCKNELVSSDRNIIELEYAGTSMESFEKFSKYNLEDENYYNIIKNTMSHVYKKTYPAGSKWKVLGLYEHTKYHLNYFLLSSVEDEEKAWVYTENLNYKECNIEVLDRDAPFEVYKGVGTRKAIEF